MRRDVCILGAAGLIVMFTMACSGSGGQQSFASTQREVIPTNVIGKSDTSGISAGAAFQAPGAAEATRTPTHTPAPSK